MAINDDKWQILFTRHQIVQAVQTHGYFDITATQIKTVREPRLMCKMDFRQSVAKPFKDNGLSILAINNGLYRIAATEPFFDIDLNKIGNIKIMDFQLPTHIETLHFENITGESQALDAAVISGMLDSLLGEECDLTIRGRRYSSKMDIELGAITYPIASVQIEVDGGYEGQTKLVLIEAKMGATDNMNMRQLIYPHVHFTNQVSKPVESYLMFYETGSLFTFIKMNVEADEPILDYADAKRFRLVQTKKPRAIPKKRSLSFPQPGHGAPFPQADDFSKVLYGYLKIAKNEGTEEEIFSELPIVPRQYNYYFNAIRWLGLAEKDGRGKPIRLTGLGEELLTISEKDRLGAIREILESHPVVQHIRDRSDEPLPKVLKEKFGLIGPSMYPRRKITIQAWIKYLGQNSNLT